MNGWQAYWKIPVYLEINGYQWAGWIPEMLVKKYQDYEHFSSLVLVPLMDFLDFPSWLREFLEGAPKSVLIFFTTPTPTEVLLELSSGQMVQVRYKYDTLRVPEHLHVPVITTVEIEDIYEVVRGILPRVENLLRANVWPEVVEEPGWQRVREEFAKLDAAWNEFQARGGFPSQETEE